MARNERVRLGDVAKVISGFAFKSSAFRSEGIPVIKIKNIRVGTVDLTDADSVDASFLALDRKYHVEVGDLLISLTGSHLTQPGSVVGRVALHAAFLTKCLLNQRAGKIIICRPERCDSRFLFYQLLTEEKRRSIALMASGAASQANVSPGQVESLEVFLPPLETQRKIAAVLSEYDDLIENNARRIRILEKMAHSIYREWFFHFRFPGHEKVKMVDCALGSIPQGWELRRLGEVSSITMGQSPKSEFYNEVGMGLPFHQGVSDFGERFPTDRVYCTINNRLAERGDVLFSVRAPVGRLNLASKRIVIGRGLCAIRNMNGHGAFLFQQLKEKFLEEDTMGGGTIFKSVTKQDMNGIEILDPPAPFVDKFEAIVQPLFGEIETLTAKNIVLGRTRDLLLPRLVSGEISVVQQGSLKEE